MGPGSSIHPRGARASCSRFAAITAIGLLAATGCGGGGDGGSTGPAPAPIADTAVDYWVSGDVARWTYRLTDTRPNGAPRTLMKTVEDRGSALIAGKTVRQFVHSTSLFEPGPETEYRYFDGQSIRSVTPASIGGLVPAGADYAEVPGPLVAGQERTLIDQTESLGEDLDEDGTPETIRILVQNTEALEPGLSLPAGDFRDVLRSRTVITGTVTLSSTGEGVSASAVLTAWYAPRIGIVRRIFEDPEFAEPDNRVTEELTGFAVGTLRAGIDPGLTLLDGIGAGTDSGTPGSGGIAFGDGRALIVSSTQGVDRPGTGVEGAIVDAAGTPLWRGRLLETAPPYVLQGAAVGFDGEGFRVVAVRTIPYDSPSSYEVIAQRVSLDGQLADGPGGTVLQTGIADPSHALGAMHIAGSAGRMLLAWSRYDPTSVELAPGLATSRGWVGEARLFGASNEPLSSPLAFDVDAPAALAHHLGRYVLVTAATRSAAFGIAPTGTLSGWSIDENGVQTGPVQPIAVWPYTLGGAALQSAGGQLWLSFQASGDPAAALQAPALRVARLGRDAALLDGTPFEPGRTLAAAGDPRGLGRVAIGATTSELAWASGYDTLRSTGFPSLLLTGTAPLPETSEALLPESTAPTRPSRSMLWAYETAGVKWMGWLDNEQSATVASDRIRATLIHPRYVAP